MLADRRGYETWLRSGWRPDGGPDAGVALQLKFNPNHDPDDGRFTFATGGASSGGGSTAAAHGPEVHHRPIPGKAVFSRRAKEEGIDGEVADKLNKLVLDPHASVDITLGKLPLTVHRTEADTVTISGIGGSVEVEGHLGVVEGKQAIVMSRLQPKMGMDSLPLGYHLISFPNSIRIARRGDGRLVYGFDKPVIARSARFGRYSARDAGIFYFKH